MMPVKFGAEQELVDAVVRQMPGDVEVFEGVPCLSRCIDLVVVDGGTIWSIEFKLRDWRRALAQAQDHLLAVDKSYVCLPYRRLTPDMDQAFRTASVGLLLYSNDDPSRPLVEAIPAPVSQVKWNVAQEWLKEALAQRRPR